MQEYRMNAQEIQAWIDNYDRVARATRWAIFDKMPVGVDHMADSIAQAQGGMLCRVRYWDYKEAKTRYTIVMASEIEKAMREHPELDTPPWHRCEKGD